MNSRRVRLSPAYRLVFLLSQLSLLALLGFVLAACGGSDGDDDTSAPPGPTPTGAVSSTITAEGGTVTVVTSERATVTFTFPPDAASVPLDVTLTPQAPTGGAWFAVGVSPSGILLKAPLQIRVDLPASIPDAKQADGVLRFVGDGDAAALATSWTGSGLEALTLGLGLPGFVGGPASTAARVPADGVAVLARQAGLLPSPADVLQAIEMPLSMRMALTDTLIDAFLATRHYRDAGELASTVSLVLAKRQKDPSTEQNVRVWAEKTWNAICSGFADARLNMSQNQAAGHPRGPAEAEKFTVPVLGWARNLDLLGAVYPEFTCPAYNDGSYTQEILDYYSRVKLNAQADQLAMLLGDCQETPATEWSPYMQSGRCASLGVDSAQRVVAAMVPADVQLTTVDDWEHLADTAVRANLFADKITYLGLDPADEKTALIDPHFELARELAWAGCRRDRSSMPVGKLLAVLPERTELREDGQYCATVLDAQAQTTGGTVTAQLEEPLGGVRFGETNTAGTIDADKGGTLALSGPIQGLWCPATSTGGSEELTVKLDGTTVQTVQATPYLGDPLAIDLASALSAAHPEGTSLLTEGTLTVERTGTPCDGFWGDNPAPLLTLTAMFTQPRIAFTREGDIYSMNPDGSSVTQLTSGTANDIQPAWSVDRNRLAFARGTAGDYNIFVMNADGSDVTQLTTSAGTFGDYNPTWSPDGLMLAFQRYDANHNSHIFRMNADGSGVVQLTTSGEDNQDPVWSPDGSKIAFSRGRYDSGTNSPELSVMSLDGSGIINLTNDAETDLYPSWSPDGTEIVYSRLTGSSCAIYSVNADGTGLTQITSGIPCCNYYPAWSPDGTNVAFRMATDNSTENGIYVIHADGTGLTRLTSGGDSYPAW